MPKKEKNTQKSVKNLATFSIFKQFAYNKYPSSV